MFGGGHCALVSFWCYSRHHCQSSPDATVVPIDNTKTSKTTNKKARILPPSSPTSVITSNNQPRQPKSNLTTITYNNRGYGARQKPPPALPPQPRQVRLKPVIRAIRKASPTDVPKPPTTTEAAMKTLISNLIDEARAEQHITPPPSFHRHTNSKGQPLRTSSRTKKLNPKYLTATPSTALSNLSTPSSTPTQGRWKNTDTSSKETMQSSG